MDKEILERIDELKELLKPENLAILTDEQIDEISDAIKKLKECM